MHVLHKRFDECYYGRIPKIRSRAQETVANQARALLQSYVSILTTSYSDQLFSSCRNTNGKIPSFL